jgi:hypothetical protein
MDEYDKKALEVGCLHNGCGGQLCQHMTARIAAALRESAACAYEDAANRTTASFGMSQAPTFYGLAAALRQKGDAGK